jgi:hypothetical protein
MAIPWKDQIKALKQLTIFPTAKVTGGPWASVFKNALDEFNKLSRAHNLGVTFKKAETPPDTSGPGGADVQFDTVNGTATFTALNTTSSLTLDGNALEGHTQTLAESFSGPQGSSSPRIAKAFIFVPSTPKFGGASSRVVGDPVKLVIAVHELIHACGLQNSDHSTGANADVFFSIPSSRERVRPADDRLVVGNPSKELPPIFLNGSTVQLIKATWT